MNLDWLRYFATIAETRNFHEAARHLHVTPQTLSKALALLEAHLGVRLIERGRRVEGLSAAGTLFLPEALAILARVENAERLAAEWREEKVRGPVAIAGNTIWHHLLLPPILAELVAAHPQLQPRLYFMRQDEVEREVAAGHVDLGLLVRPPQRPELAFEAGPASPYVIAGLPRPACTWHDLGFVVPRLYGKQVAEALDGWPDAQYRRRIVAEVERLETAIRLVQAGVGVAFVPRLVIEDELHRGTLAEVAPAPVEREDRLYAVWRADVHPTPAMRVITAALRAPLASKA